MRRAIYLGVIILIIAPLLAALAGGVIGRGILHPQRLPMNEERMEWANRMLRNTGATKEAFEVRAPDGIVLRGWKVRPPTPNGSWVLVYHGIADNRAGCSGHAEFLLRHGYSIVMMDSRAQGESSGDMVTFGWKERYDTVGIVDALYSSEKIQHLYALGVSMGAALALQSAAVEPRIEAVAVEDPFANLREVSYDYAGLFIDPWLGKTLFRPAVIVAMNAVEKEGGFTAEDASPETAVAARPFAVLLICGTSDRRVPSRPANLRIGAGPERIVGR